MAAKGQIVSHWYHLTEGLQQSSQEFYRSVEQAVQTREMTKVALKRASYHEGGVLSAKREYLEIKRHEHTFCICAAPFGTGFFISWWLLEKPSSILLQLLGFIPFVGPVVLWAFQPVTYYRVDTALMFQESIHLAVLEILDQITTAKGLRLLSETERKPIMAGFFKK